MKSDTQSASCQRNALFKFARRTRDASGVNQPGPESLSPHQFSLLVSSTSLLAGISADIPAISFPATPFGAISVSRRRDDGASQDNGHGYQGATDALSWDPGGGGAKSGRVRFTWGINRTRPIETVSVHPGFADTG